MRRFIVVGQRARASPDFSLADIPSTSGRLDVLVRCLRAALLVSHGVRRDVTVYLCLLGDPERLRTLRFAGPLAKYMRPDERSLASVVKKALAIPCEHVAGAFVEVRHGIAVADGGVECVWPELDGAALYLLEEGAPDLREHVPAPADSAFVIGDHVGIPAAVRDAALARGARPVSVGPVSLHAEDVITLISNELDRAG